VARRGAAGAAGVLAALAAITGCASPGSGIQAGEHVTVYVSVPLRGEAANGRDVAQGARLALGDAGGRVGGLEVRAVYLDDTGGRGGRARWSGAAAAANAREATEDSTAIAYVGEFDSGATRFSLPVTNEARLLQVSPASAAIDLVQPYLDAGDQVPEDVQPTGERTFGRVIPSDEAQAEAGAAWARHLGAGAVAIERGRSSYDRVVASAFDAEARALGLRVGRDPASLSGGELVYLALEPSELSRGTTAAGSGTPSMGTDALLDSLELQQESAGSEVLLTSAAQAPSQLAARGRRFVGAFRDRYRRPPGRYAAYGYEAMAVVLDSIRRAGDSGDDRDAVIDAFFDTRERDSVLGPYSIDDVGDTTLNRLTGYRVVRGRARAAAELRVP
jgi:branched-chain amino acid transport system substrate-binding protein